MMIVARSSPLTRKLVDSLYTEAMILSDEARAYFDEGCVDMRGTLPSHERVLFSCEALKVTSRLTHIIVWLLSARGGEAGFEAGREQAFADIAPSSALALARLPVDAQALITQSQVLYARVARLDRKLRMNSAPSPVLQMIRQISAAF